MDAWLNENCKLLETDSEMATALPGFIAYKEQFRGIPGNESLDRYYFVVLVRMDRLSFLLGRLLLCFLMCACDVLVLVCAPVMC